MTRAEIFEGLKEIIQTIKPKMNLDNVSEQSMLVTDLGIDSLSMLLLSLATEQKFQIRFETQKPFERVSDVIDYIIGIRGGD
ncbi:MAG: hypothetical protein IJU63_04915 [Bacteroidales bacterium]|nr:hypothetical protein [Bacteroidales bacterium]